MNMPKDHRIHLWLFVREYVKDCLERGDRYRGNEYYAVKTFHALEKLLTDEDRLGDLIKDEEDSANSMDFDYAEEIHTMKKVGESFQEEIEAYLGKG
jgi:hypothetical protein